MKVSTVSEFLECLDVERASPPDCASRDADTRDMTEFYRRIDDGLQSIPSP